jgi:uncharacterized protein YkwD
MVQLFFTGKVVRVGVPSVVLLLTALSASGVAKNTMSEEILAAHNQYRKAVGVSPLVWSDTLAQDAQQWADKLAAMAGKTLQHSKASDRPRQGENLWMGSSAKRYSYTNMVDFWGAEKKVYRGEAITASNFLKIGHYTQIVWRNTTQVGCATTTAGGNDILVCRYSPSGGVLGKRPY